MLVQALKKGFGAQRTVDNHGCSTGALNGKRTKGLCCMLSEGKYAWSGET